MSIHSIHLKCDGKTIDIRTSDDAQSAPVDTDLPDRSRQLTRDYGELIAAQQRLGVRPEKSLEELADVLTTQILSGKVATYFAKCLQSTAGPLEIRIRGCSWFINLPWELLRPKGRWLLLNSRNTSVVRASLRAYPYCDDEPTIGDPLRVLFVPAEVVNAPVYWQDARCELERRLWPWMQTEQVSVVTHNDPRKADTLGVLSQLMNTSFDVLYLLAHGHCAPSPVIDLVGRDQRRHQVGFSELVSKMVGKRPPRLLILGSCHLSNVDNELDGVAHEAVDSGVEAVFAMQSTVSALGAGAAAAVLLKELVQGRPLAAAVAAARDELVQLAKSNAGQFGAVGAGEWSLPVVWMRGDKDANHWTLRPKLETGPFESGLKQIMGSPQLTRLDLENGLATIKCLESIEPGEDQSRRDRIRNSLIDDFRKRVEDEISRCADRGDHAAAAREVFQLRTRLDDPNDESHTKDIQKFLRDKLISARHSLTNIDEAIEEFDRYSDNADAYHLVASLRPVQIEAQHERLYIVANQELDEAFLLLKEAQLNAAADLGTKALAQLNSLRYARSIEIKEMTLVFACAAQLAEVHETIGIGDAAAARTQLSEIGRDAIQACEWLVGSGRATEHVVERWRKLEQFVEEWANSVEAVHDKRQEFESLDAPNLCSRLEHEVHELHSYETRLRSLSRDAGQSSPAWLSPLSDELHPSTIAQINRLSEAIQQSVQVSVNDLLKLISQMGSLHVSLKAIDSLLQLEHARSPQDDDQSDIAAFVRPRISHESLHRFQGSIRLADVDRLDDLDFIRESLGNDAVDFLIARRNSDIARGKPDLLKRLLVRLQVNGDTLDHVLHRVAANVLEAADSAFALPVAMSLGACCALLASNSWCGDMAKGGAPSADTTAIHKYRQRVRTRLAESLLRRPDLDSAFGGLELPFSSDAEHWEAMYLSLETAEVLRNSVKLAPRHAAVLCQLWESAVRHATKIDAVDAVSRHLNTVLKSEHRRLKPASEWDDDDWSQLDVFLELLECAYTALRGTGHEEGMPGAISRLRLSRGVLALRNGESSYWLDIALDEFTCAAEVVPSIDATAGRCTAMLIKFAQLYDHAGRAELLETARALAQHHDYDELLAAVRRTVEAAGGRYNPRYATLLADAGTSRENSADLLPVDRARSAYEQGSPCDAANFLLDALRMGSAAPSPELQDLARNALTEHVDELLAPGNYTSEHLLRKSLDWAEQFQRYFPNETVWKLLVQRITNCLPEDFV